MTLTAAHTLGPGACTWLQCLHIPRCVLLGHFVANGRLYSACEGGQFTLSLIPYGKCCTTELSPGPSITFPHILEKTSFHEAIAEQSPELSKMDKR